MTREGSSERAEYWQEVLREQASSGLSISAFCRGRHVAEGSFFYWRRKLTQRQTHSKPANGEKTPRRNNSGHGTAAKFVPVEIRSAPEARHASCEIVLPSGSRIIFPTGCDVHWLREMFGALEEPAC